MRGVPSAVEFAIGGRVSVAAGVFAAGHLGELTQIVDTALVDAVVAETGTVQRRVRLLPTRVVVFFVLGLALFEDCGYRLVWDKLTASLGGLVRPSASALCRARRRVGPAPLRALFEAVAGPLAWPSTSQAFWCGLRTVAFDGTLLRLTVLVECGTRALIDAAFGPDGVGETGYARRLLGCLRPGMLLWPTRTTTTANSCTPSAVPARSGWYVPGRAAARSSTRSWPTGPI